MDGQDPQDLVAKGEDTLSVAEFETAFGALSQVDLIRLRHVALYFANRGGGEADDLLQEALARVLEGRRSCPREVSIVQFVGGIVRSLTSEANETLRKGLGPVPMAAGVAEHAEHDGPSPEREVASLIDDGAVLTKVQAMIAGDDELELLVEGICDGMKGRELEELLGIDSKRLAAVQRRLRRTLAELKAERAMA